MDDQEIDEVEGGLDDIGVGKRKTLAGPQARRPTGGSSAPGRQGTIYGASKTTTEYIDRFNKLKEIEHDQEMEKRKDPARWYRTMNFELTHMKKLQE